ncbi:MAG: 30S ribosomal protein S21 [Chrysiogenetes bacterium]|nr:30S ribosomal protein S21 [Chrysiogenetes bacterium]
MAQIVVDQNEPFDKALRRFRKLVDRSGIKQEVRRREYYMKPSELKRMKEQKAERRRLRKLRRSASKRPVRR